jgi:hypothetical protein
MLRAIEMRANGKSSKAIATAFGNPRARNTVIGRLQRAMIARGIKLPCQIQRPPVAKAAPPKQPKAKAPPKERSATPKKQSPSKPAVAPQRRGPTFRQPPDLALVSSVELPPQEPEPEPDLYAHLRSNEQYRRAVAALAPPARFADDR